MRFVNFCFSYLAVKDLSHKKRELNDTFRELSCSFSIKNSFNMSGTKLLLTRPAGFREMGRLKETSHVVGTDLYG